MLRSMCAFGWAPGVLAIFRDKWQTTHGVRRGYACLDWLEASSPEAAAQQTGPQQLAIESGRRHWMQAH